MFQNKQSYEKKNLLSDVFVLHSNKSHSKKNKYFNALEKEHFHELTSKNKSIFMIVLSNHTVNTHGLWNTGTKRMEKI